MSICSVNAVYLNALAKNPLLTKAITAGILNGLNELIASAVSKDYSSFALKPNSKIIQMIFYGSCILTPVSHNLYGVLTRIFGNAGGKNLTPVLKALQIITSLVTITPILSGIFTSWISIINNYKPDTDMAAMVSSSPKKVVVQLKHEILKVKNIVQKGLSQNYPRILRGSLVTNLMCLMVAQNLLSPELWVVFFNAVYFVLNTYQNTRIKIQKKKEVSRAQAEQAHTKPKVN